MEGQSNCEERIVMTPCKKGQGYTKIRVERCRQNDVDKGSVMHVAGGDHKGIVINKEVSADNNSSPAHLSVEFKVFLTCAKTNVHTQECRTLNFWFNSDVSEAEQMHTAQNFFKDLINPYEMPRDYVGFIKKIMKLMQLTYLSVKKIEVEIKQLGDDAKIPSRPMSMDESFIGTKAEITEDKVLEIVESAYPNPLTIENIAKSIQTTEEEIHMFVRELVAKGILKSMDNGTYTRAMQNDTEVKMVKQMPMVVRSQQPTIAIITANFNEKMAVDAMIENKDTYVRYKTEGDSNIYTLGTIGHHRVVCTKLPAVGHARGAMIAAGNTTTRLLGTFQKVEFVFLVGIGGGIPHYTDFSRHVRLGDIVVAAPPSGSQNYIYLYCEKNKGSPEGTNGTPDTYNVKQWGPPSLYLQHIARQLWDQGAYDPEERSWEEHIKEGIRVLKTQDRDFTRPANDTDKLHMNLGGTDVIEVSHPQAPEGVFDPRTPGTPVVHFGAVGSGRALIRDDAIRHEFAHQYGILGFDTEYDAVVESIYGNRKDNYIFIRGVADYKDGTKKKDWQPYAALVSAAFMKAVICAMAPYEDD